MFQESTKHIKVDQMILNDCLQLTLFRSFLYSKKDGFEFVKTGCFNIITLYFRIAC